MTDKLPGPVLKAGGGGGRGGVSAPWKEHTGGHGRVCGFFSVAEFRLPALGAFLGNGQQAGVSFQLSC